MNSNRFLDSEIYPPFTGFPREGVKFLARLKKNNNREWFARHKPEYEDFVKLPMQSLLASLAGPMASIAPEIDIHPKRSLFRIYRDIRFSKNKSPYKTHVAAVFGLMGNWGDSAGFYVHVEPGRIYVGGGIYMPNGDQLKKIRKAINERSGEFLAIVGNKTFKRKFGTFEGEKLQRAPLGFAPDDPMIEWLKFKSFYTGLEWGEKECYSSKFVNKIVAVYEDILPLVRFLNSALGKNVKSGS
jgi:uncharacterized protein (TIGR02453 family)